MTTRRLFLQLAALTAAGTLGAADFPTPLSLPPLRYSYDALEPYIDTQTMQIHHDKHHQAYGTNLNKAIGGDPVLSKLSIDDLMMKLDTLPAAVRTAVRNQGGGHSNHSLFWLTLAPASQSGKPGGSLAAALNKTFGSQEKFEAGLRTEAIGVFGSGWAWLATDQTGKLAIESTSNQDTPLSSDLHPLIGIDVWEHAYYLKYQNRRPEYVGAFFHVINWDFVTDRYKKLTA